MVVVAVVVIVRASRVFVGWEPVPILQNQYSGCGSAAKRVIVALLLPYVVRYAAPAGAAGAAVSSWSLEAGSLKESN
jgi:hypothetical protein